MQSTYNSKSGESKTFIGLPSPMCVELPGKYVKRTQYKCTPPHV